MIRKIFNQSTVLPMVAASLVLAIASGSALGKPDKPKKPNKKEPTTVTEDLTGCLHTKNGRLRHLGEGGEPLKKCNKQESIVTLDVVGLNEVEPFAIALDDGEEVVVAESNTDPSTNISVECVPPEVLLHAHGTIINGAASPVDLAALAAGNELPLLLDDDGSILSIFGIRVGLPDESPDCVVSGVVQRSVLEDAVP